MSGVIIEELDDSSEDSFGTPKSAQSTEAFHDPEESSERKGKSAS